jgi:hypothetical protein
MLNAANQIRGPKKVLSGLVFVIIGVGAFIWSQTYQVGTATRMGAGYFPALLGLVLAGIGLASIVQGFLMKKADPIEARSLEPVFLVLASVVSFGFLVVRTGMLPAIAVSVLFVCARRAISNPLEVALLILSLWIFCGVVFVRIFEMTIPLYTWNF